MPGAFWLLYGCPGQPAAAALPGRPAELLTHCQPALKSACALNDDSRGRSLCDMISAYGSGHVNYYRENPASFKTDARKTPQSGYFLRVPRTCMSDAQIFKRILVDVCHGHALRCEGFGKNYLEACTAGRKGTSEIYDMPGARMRDADSAAGSGLVRL